MQGSLLKIKMMEYYRTTTQSKRIGWAVIGFEAPVPIPGEVGRQVLSVLSPPENIVAMYEASYEYGRQ